MIHSCYSVQWGLYHSGVRSDRRHGDKKLSQEFSWKESRTLGTLSKLVELLLNPQVQAKSATIQGTLRNSNTENQEPNEDCFQNGFRPEVGSSIYSLPQFTNLDSDEASYTIQQRHCFLYKKTSSFDEFRTFWACILLFVFFGSSCCNERWCLSLEKTKECSFGCFLNFKPKDFSETDRPYIFFSFNCLKYFSCIKQVYISALSTVKISFCVIWMNLL